ncbi:hypothetical protein BDZ97DRAFT_1756668 [Flammula alnicola]|nr:hypothetical protein BDZ97DRAFT_1756668 [Flammula alnicola]
MVAFTRAAFTLLSGLISLVAVSSSPLDFSSLNVTDLLPRAENAVPSAPHFVIYSDKWVNGQTGPPSVDQIKLIIWVDEYGIISFSALSFLLSRGPADQAQAWAQLTDAQRKSIKAKYSAAGIKLIVSLFGSTETPTSSNVDPIGTANTMAAWVKKYGLDGVDVDYEDLAAMNAGNGKAELRKQLPQGQYILTHAPVAPWFSPNKFGGGGYLKVHQTVGNMIDWYNIQVSHHAMEMFMPTHDYRESSASSTTRVQPIHYLQWPLNSFSNVGLRPRFSRFPRTVSHLRTCYRETRKPSDASNGYIAPSDLATCVSQAKGKGWKAGVMVWEYPDAAASWIKTVRGSAFPV